MKLEYIPTTEEEIQKYYDDSQVKKIKTVVDEMPDRPEDVYTFGFPIFEEAMDGGIEGGDLIIVSGQTSQGKTTFAQTITHKVLEKKVPCLWFSYEMPIKQIWKKFQDMGIAQEADHIKSFAHYPELRFELSNGRTLCLECHKKTDTYKTKSKIYFNNQYTIFN